MSGSLDGRIALVTGGSRGIGAAIALAFAREGARVAICGRHEETLKEVAQQGEGRILPIACHVGRAEEIARLAETVERELGPLEILVNNAATIVQQGPCLEATVAQFDKMIELNLKSAFRLISRFAPGMCERGRGSIINIASVAGIQPQLESLLYSMTKAALVMMTRSYALELGPYGVRVNAIAPGLIETKLSEYFWKDPERREQHFGRQPIGRLGQPEDIAGLAVLLAGDAGSYITGSVMPADGGLLLA